jgi:chorismate mutase / prephenate dehydratase
MSAHDDLQSIRDKIEALDKRLLTLLAERMQLVESVAESKLANAAPFRDAPREEHVLQRIRHLAAELGLDAHEVERLYRVVLEMSVAHQAASVRTRDTAPLRVAYQGVESSFSHMAAQRRYSGRSGGALLTGHETFRQAVNAVLIGEADVALLPIENSTAGSINETYDLLTEGGVTITAEVVSAIEHCLLGLPGVKKEDIRVVLSHPQALMQCSVYFQRNPWMRPQPEFDTAGAARKVRDGGDPSVAAIAGASAASRYNLQVLEHAIQTETRNSTRFVEIAREPLPCPADASCKTSIVVALANRPGALGDVLMEFGRRGINLTKLESRPVPGEPWAYRFYLDVEGHASSVVITEALSAVRVHVSDLRILGTYPKAG